jgi:hypothetical protein
MKRTLIATVGLVVLLCSPALANPTWEDISFQTALRAMNSHWNTPGVRLNTHIYRHDPTIRPDINGPAVIANFVMTGDDFGPGQVVPCFNCVTGDANPNIGLTQPRGYIPLTVANLQYVALYNDVNDTATCNFTMALTQGVNTLFSVNINIPLNASTEYMTSTGTARSASWHGKALLAVGITCPGKPAATTKTTVFFQ